MTENGMGGIESARILNDDHTYSEGLFALAEESSSPVQCKLPRTGRENGRYGSNISLSRSKIPPEARLS